MWRVALVALALIAALVPIPSAPVERYYSSRAYPALQHAITPISNLTAVAWFDLLVLAAAAMAIVLLVRRGRILNLLGFAAFMYLFFLATWGLNYRRVPLREKLQYDERRLTAENVTRTTHRAIDAINNLYAAAHETNSDQDLAITLAPAMNRAAPLLHLRPPVPARPKHTWLAGYFRGAGIDGLTDPFFLETLLASNLLEIERPAALAHEWGHLAGLADESEASFFGWLTCLAGDGRAQYSGWVALYPHLLGAVPSSARHSLNARLDRGPAEDFRRIAARLQQTNKTLRLAANTTYDKFLKANRVPEGIESYDAVVRLVVGVSWPERFSPPRN